MNAEQIEETTGPRIYVASLSDYNAGTLHGRWIDAAQDADDIAAEVAEMLKESPTARAEGLPAEEWAIHDYDGFDGLELGEWESFEKVAEHAAMLEEHGPAWAAYVNMEGADYATSEDFADKYRGEWDSEENFAENLAEETGAIDPNQDHHWPTSYIDWERAARDLFISDCYSVENPTGGIFVFWR